MRILMTHSFCYVPELQQDELLYSFLARLIAYNALHDPRAYLQLLFGTRDVVPGVDLPTRLTLLQEHLGVFSPCLSADELIDVGTLYPYHRPFLSTERHESVREILLSGGGKGLKTLMGRVANRFGANPPLRYCLSCTAEDIARNGMPYWHRSHQLPGVTCCIRHRSELVVHVFPEHSGDKRRLVLAPPRKNIIGEPVACDSAQLKFAILSKDLLDARLPVLSLEKRRHVYVSAAMQLGFRSRGNRIDQDALATALRAYYGDFGTFSHRDRLLSSQKKPLRWLSTLLDKPARSSHPICHLLLIGFLFGSIDAFCQALRAAEPMCCSPVDSQHQVFGGGRASEFRENHGALLRDTSISCRRAAHLLNVSVTTVVQQRRHLGVPIAERRKNLHPDRISAINMALMKGISPLSIAKQHRLSVSTVYRVRAMLPGLAETHAKSQHARELEMRRSEWTLAMARHRGCELRVVRGGATAAYAWLYRHDRAWLLERTGGRRVARHSKSWVNWEERDAALCQRLHEHVDCLRREESRPRISKTLMLRVVGDAMVRANFERLPRLKEMIHALTESPESFRRFRIDRAIRDLCADNIQVRLWRVQRLAGIHFLTPALRDYAEKRMKDTRESGQ
jgi:hypothetical protein